ncbi:COX assembly mitochondrial protein homolog [Daphnia magna]|uniref:COX assembly mitochondrial protein n=1 Tax=Daphnia magna TaxID=35525 RepID=A0A0N8D859_9CRUS|nr:COX assembly mitochondrial protein homolog [Daphnia magna]KAK4019132.1 hypothetical protein OUZ56_001162 [Daphnia magna]
MPTQDESHKSNLTNPHGLGDPDDRRLRIVEKEVLIPKIMRDRAKKEKCVAEVAEFTKCCAASSLLMAYTCRKENALMQECQSRWYKDEGFKKECEDIYFKERREFRLTGIPKKHRLKEPGNETIGGKSTVD